jgi:hypothetical protein
MRGSNSAGRCALLNIHPMLHLFLNMAALACNDETMVNLVDFPGKKGRSKVWNHFGFKRKDGAKGPNCKETVDMTRALQNMLKIICLQRWVQICTKLTWSTIDHKC